MGFAEAIFYFAIAYFVVPHSRDEVPFKQFGLNFTQLM